MACSVAAVQPRHTELLEATGGGLLYDSAEAEGLVSGLEESLLNPGLARDLGERGRHAVVANYTADRMARDVVEVCARL